VSVRSVVEDRPLLRRAAVPLAAFAATAGIGIAGFTTLGGVGVVEAAFWLLDPTSIELHLQEVDHGSETVLRGFALVVFAALIVSSVWIGETVLSAAFGGQIRGEIRRVQTKRAIDDLTDHAIVCGYGLFGRTVAARLQEKGQSVVALEVDEAAYGRIDTDEVLVLNGDARNEQVLRDAGIKRAKTVIAAIDDSNANIQIAITASQLAPEVRVIVRVGDEEYSALARRAGADEVVVPEVVSGEQVSDRL
jgi:hypothetical protein